jgi:hypothetical protein
MSSFRTVDLEGDRPAPKRASPSGQIKNRPNECYSIKAKADDCVAESGLD